MKFAVATLVPALLALSALAAPSSDAPRPCRLRPKEHGNVRALFPNAYTSLMIPTTPPVRRPNVHRQPPHKRREIPRARLQRLHSRQIPLPHTALQTQLRSRLRPQRRTLLPYRYLAQPRRDVRSRKSLCGVPVWDSAAEVYDLCEGYKVWREGVYEKGCVSGAEFEFVGGL